jgi:tetratricopeptide (TPR) repeat protein
MHIRLPRLSGCLRRTVHAAAIACLLGAGTALAECVVPAGMPDDATLDRLINALPECERDAEYLAALGNILNQRGRYAEAGDHLERALMLAPDLKGARLDYAISLAGMGEVESARLLLEDILADPNLPPNLKPALERQRRNLASIMDWQVRALLGARIGYDSNLLGSPDLSALTLTFPDQTVVLPLDEASRPKAGSYNRVDLQLEARKLTPSGGQIESFLALRGRRSASVPEAHSQQTDAMVDYSSYQRRNNGGGFYTGASASMLRAESGIRYNSYGLAAGIGSSRWLTACDGRLGLEVQERKYLNNDLLSGRYSGITSSLSCDRQGIEWLASAKAGMDKARHIDRAGGDQVQYALRGAFVVSNFGPKRDAKGRLWLDFEFNRSRDSSGYSPLLESGRSRVINRASSRIEYQYPLSNSLQWIAGAEWVSQHSSLALFANRSWGPYLAIRGAW